MRIRRRLTIPLAVVLIVAAIALLVTLRKHAPPEAARLLPGADGFFYVNLKWIRTFNATSQLPPVSREPEYQKFVEETGFQFERDLEQAAFAITIRRVGAAARLERRQSRAFQRCSSASSIPGG